MTTSENNLMASFVKPYLFVADGEENKTCVKDFMKLISIVGVFLSFLTMASARVAGNMVFSFAGHWLEETVSFENSKVNTLECI